MLHYNVVKARKHFTHPCHCIWTVTDVLEDYSEHTGIADLFICRKIIVIGGLTSLIVFYYIRKHANLWTPYSHYLLCT